MGSHGLNAEELPDRRAEHGVTVPHLSIITATKFVQYYCQNHHHDYHQSPSSPRVYGTSIALQLQLPVLANTVGELPCAQIEEDLDLAFKTTANSKKKVDAPAMLSLIGRVLIEDKP